MRNTLGVMRGLDPRIHDESQHRWALHTTIFDRDKPGNDRKVCKRATHSAHARESGNPAAQCGVYTCSGSPLAWG